MREKIGGGLSPATQLVVRSKRKMKKCGQASHPAAFAGKMPGSECSLLAQ
jgi:hypothetical protein